MKQDRSITAGQRHFLFLQGLAGPFFQKLGKRLATMGHSVHRVNFHGGDWLFWPSGINYRGGEQEWPETVERLITEHSITDLVLFGDCRPLHRAAIKVAQRLQIEIHVFEEGYIRPDWVTVERGGVNGHSALPRNLDYYLEAARQLPPLAESLDALPPVPSSFRRRALEDLQYNFAAMLLWPIFPRYNTHRPYHPLHEYAGWARRLLGKRAARRRASAIMDTLRQDGRPFFVFPLQLDCDYQVRMHSPFKGLMPAIRQVLGSFARHAPADHLLVVKAHPLDNGIHNWKRLTLDEAARQGIADRVVFLEEGDIMHVTRPARGMVTINSTSGTLALACDVPVIVLGHAVYNVPGLTYAGALDEFWAEPTKPKPGAYEAFRRILVDRCLVRGGYFSDIGLDMLVEGSAARLARTESRVRTALAPIETQRNTATAIGETPLGAVRG